MPIGGVEEEWRKRNLNKCDVVLGGGHCHVHAVHRVLACRVLGLDGVLDAIHRLGVQVCTVDVCVILVRATWEEEGGGGEGEERGVFMCVYACAPHIRINDPRHVI